MRRFVSQTATISKLGHPGIVPVYEIGTRAQLTYLSMRLVSGGTTLKDLLAHGTLDVGTAWRVLRAVAEALHSAHEVGVVHQDLKPSNVLIERDGSILVTDFGLARISYGYAIGTPGYMAPEQAQGLPTDRRADVHALGLLAFEMLTGTRPYVAPSPVDLILSTVHDPVPSARSLNPELPPELDLVLFRALAKAPSDRPGTVEELLAELSQVPLSKTSVHGVSGGQAWGADYQLVTLFEASHEPVVAIDESGLVTHWNGQAEALFGWARKQIVGLPILTTLVAPRYREVLERVFATFLANPAQETQAIEVMALSRDGRQVPLELSISRVQVSPARGNLVVFCRDISERKENERLRTLQDLVTDVMADADGADALSSRLLELVCTHLDWAAGALWRVDAESRSLRCQDFWQVSTTEGAEFEVLTRRLPRRGPG